MCVIFRCLMSHAHEQRRSGNRSRGRGRSEPSSAAGVGSCVLPGDGLRRSARLRRVIETSSLSLSMPPLVGIVTVHQVQSMCVHCHAPLESGRLKMVAATDCNTIVRLSTTVVRVSTTVYRLRDSMRALAFCICGLLAFPVSWSWG